MKNLEFSEIRNDNQFESLAASYFKHLYEKTDGVLVDTKVTGEEQDGGVDVILKLKTQGPIVEYERKWVIECKFYTRKVNLDAIKNHNIPTLIHQHNAAGYLLICSNGVSSSVFKKFAELNKNCNFKYRYEIWNGETFKSNILTLRNNKLLLQQYFPSYYNFLRNLK